MAITSKIKKYFLPTKENKFCPVLLSNQALIFYIILFLTVNVGLGMGSVLLRQTNLFADVSSQAILNLTNKTRASYNLPPVVENSLLDKAAQEKAEDMIKHGYFGHFSPSGVSPWHWMKNAGYKYHYAGENLALNFVDSDDVVRAWLNSPSHRANLLNKHYRNIGIAVGSGDVYGDGVNRTFVIQMFGSPLLATRAPANAKKLVVSNTSGKSSSAPASNSRQDSVQTPAVIPTTRVSGAESVSSGPSTTTSSTSPNSVTSNYSSTSLTSTSSATPSSIANISSSTKNASSFPMLLSSRQTKGIPEKKFLSLAGIINPKPIKMIDEIIAGFMFLIGGISIWFVVKKPRKVDFHSPELAWRSMAVILLAVSFIAFNIAVILGGPLIVS